MNTSDLLQLRVAIADVLSSDPLSELIHTMVWLDPIWLEMPLADKGLFNEASDFMADFEDCDPAENALQIVRHLMPLLYLEAVECIRAGTTYYQLERLLCGALDDMGFEMSGLESMCYGIPVPAYGISLYGDDYGSGTSEYPQVEPVLPLFDAVAQDDTWQIPDYAFEAGTTLSASLHATGDERLINVGYFLLWLWGYTGNTCADCTWEHIVEFDPMPWTKDNVAFACDMIEEARDIMKQVWAGLDVLLNDRELWAAMKRNVQIAKKYIESEVPYERWNKLDWPGIGRGAEGTAGAGPELLQLRGVAP